MEEQTRHVFFSLGSGSAHYDNHELGGPEDHEASHNAGTIAAKSSQQRKAGTVSHGGDGNKQQFSANFERKEAWQSIEQPTIRTPGIVDSRFFFCVVE